MINETIEFDSTQYSKELFGTIEESIYSAIFGLGHLTVPKKIILQIILDIRGLDSSLFSIMCMSADRGGDIKLIDRITEQAKKQLKEILHKAQDIRNMIKENKNEH